MIDKYFGLRFSLSRIEFPKVPLGQPALWLWASEDPMPSEAGAKQPIVDRKLKLKLWGWIAKDKMWSRSSVALARELNHPSSNTCGSNHPTNAPATFPANKDLEKIPLCYFTKYGTRAPHSFGIFFFPEHSKFLPLGSFCCSIFHPRSPRGPSRCGRAVTDARP